MSFDCYRFLVDMKLTLLLLFVVLLGASTSFGQSKAGERSLRGKAKVIWQAAWPLGTSAPKKLLHPTPPLHVSQANFPRLDARMAFAYRHEQQRPASTAATSGRRGFVKASFTRTLGSRVQC